MKDVKCIKCGQKFEMPDDFYGRILCEDCDPFYAEPTKIDDPKEEIERLKEGNRKLMDENIFIFFTGMMSALGIWLGTATPEPFRNSVTGTFLIAFAVIGGWNVGHGMARVVAWLVKNKRELNDKKKEEQNK